jgi:glycosyltransferase involved in cell wall biosynthesis
MKILFYYYVGGGGGLSNIVLLLKAMARRHPEDSIEIVTSSSARFAALGDVPNIQIKSVRITGTQEFDRLLLGVTILSRIARDIKADVVWSMNLGPYVKIGVPCVLSIHNPHQVYPWKLSRYHPSRRAAVAALRWFFRRSLRISDAAIVQTPIMGDYVRRIPGGPTKVCVAAKAVDREIDIRSEALPSSLQAALEGGLGPDAFTFLYVSTWAPHKNHVTLLRTFSQLARRKIRARVVLTVNAEEILAAGWPQSSVLVDAGYVVPAGWVQKHHLRSLYTACDACLMPSVLESLSSAHLEAMQWRRPQIAADLPYAHDLCGRAALYANAEDPEAWVQKIERLMDDESIRVRLIDAGSDRMTRYPGSWDEAAETVHQFLSSVRVEALAESGATAQWVQRPQGRI